MTYSDGLKVTQPTYIEMPDGMRREEIKVQWKVSSRKVKFNNVSENTILSHVLSTKQSYLKLIVPFRNK